MLQLVKTAGAPAANKHRVKLNDRFIGDLQPRSKPFLIFDSEQVGLAVQVQPSGHRSFKCIYNRKGQTRWYHIGNALAIKVAQARTLANEIMYQVIQDKGDPVADRKAKRLAATFEELAKQYCKYAANKNKSWRSTDKLIKRYVVPSWGKLRASDITRSDANTLMTGISAPITANQVLASTSAIFSWAIRKELGGVKINPCHLVERNPTKKRERILSDSEMPCRAYSSPGAQARRRGYSLPPSAHPISCGGVTLAMSADRGKADFATARVQVRKCEGFRMPAL